MDNLEVSIATGDTLDVRQFSVSEALSSLFVVSLVVVTKNQNIDFDAVVGKPARFVINTLTVDQDGEDETGAGNLKLAAPRFWDGICDQIQQLQAEETGLSTYFLTIVPTMWFLTQRRNYRIFQQLSEPVIAQKLLAEWQIEPEMRLEIGDYKKRKYKVQYAESDYDFVSRMLEEAGITFYFRQEDGQTKLVLSDKPQMNEPRKAKLPYVDNPSDGGVKKEHVTAVLVNQKVRPGKYTIRDHDYRRQPDYKLLATGSGGLDVEQKLERFHYTPGAFLFGADKGEETPAADDKGRARTDEREGAALAQKRADAKRGNAKGVSFSTNALDLAPGAVVSLLFHPRSDLGENKKLLIVEATLNGTRDGSWGMGCQAMSAEHAYRPPLKTLRPKISGVESATVVGPKGEEIHTDEFGRVRVHFHWDRESKMDDNSSCWIHVSQPWSGSGYGASNLPRVGQEVLVDFLGGDPDRPIITGRVHTNLQKTPYKLPEGKTQTGWRSQSTGGSGGYNELMFDDKAGSELFSTRAERDRRSLTKRNADESIGGSRATEVAKDDTETVGGSQRIAVGGGREVNVGGEERRTVKATITFTSQEGDTRFESKNAFHSSATRHTFESAGAIEITCQGSTIVITPDSINLSSPSVLVNGAPISAGGGDSGSPPAAAE